MVGGQGKALWQYIKDFFYIDRKNGSFGTRQAPKLTEKHIFLPPFSKMSVKRAAQVLSNTVSSGIDACMEQGTIPKTATTTSIFVKNFNDLFDVFNIRSKKDKRPLRCAITPNSSHLSFLKYKKTWLGKLKSLSPKLKQELPCLMGWKLTINSLLELSRDLWENDGLSFLLTNRLNQDPLENLFSVIRGKRGHGCNPDAYEFRIAFGTVIVDNLLVPSQGSNCEDDLSDYLFSLDNLKSFGKKATLKSKLSKVVPSSIIHDVPSLPMHDQNTNAYIGGWIAKKLSGKVCEDCTSKLTKQKTCSDERHVFLMNKQYDDIKLDQGLKMPSDELFAFLETAELSFRKQAPSRINKPHVMHDLVKILLSNYKDDYFSSCQKCNLKFLILFQYIKCRLYFLVKLINQEEKVKKAQSKRKLKILRHS